MPELDASLATGAAQSCVLRAARQRCVHVRVLYVPQGAQAAAEMAMKAGDRLAGVQCSFWVVLRRISKRVCFYVSGLLARLVAALPTLESCALRKA